MNEMQREKKTKEKIMTIKLETNKKKELHASLWTSSCVIDKYMKKKKIPVAAIGSEIIEDEIVFNFIPQGAN